MRVNLKPISHVSNYHRFVHSPGVISNHETFYTCTSTSNGAIVDRERMLIVNLFSFGKHCILPSVPESIFPLKMEDQVGLFTNLFPIMVLHFASTCDQAE